MSGLIKNGMILAKEVEGELWIKASLHNLEVKRAVDAEREACAKVCDYISQTHLQKESHTTSVWASRECADAIRARGQE